MCSKLKKRYLSESSQPVDIPSLVISESPDFDENKERGNWSNGMEFLLSCLSYAVGLGNVWRFPYLVYRNGGGAFFIPYTVMLVFVGIPLFLLELGFGQYASEGPITIWKVSPMFQGLGYAMFLMSGLVSIYYNMILAWGLFYLVSSFTTTLPWKSCDNFWNTDACRRFDAKNCTSHNGTMLANSTCIARDCYFANGTNVIDQHWNPAKLNTTVLNATCTIDDPEWTVLKLQNTKMASDEYFHNFVLGITEGIHDLGGMRLELALCLFVCWLIVFVCLVRGVKSMGKVVYFTALFPYFVLLILLVRGLTLPGAAEGIRYYLTPEWYRLTEAQVWADAAMQIFFSLSPCWGGLITLASYNRFHNNFYRDTFFISIGNCGTSIFAGFVIFSIIGFMAHEMGVDVNQVATQGAGLAFVVYPEAVSRLPISPLWSFLFFFMLLTLGLGTQFTLIETVVTTIVDTWPDKFRHRKPLVLAATCGFMFLVGLLICTKAGMYILQLMDNHCASFSALIIGLVEVVVIGWVYGIDRFLDDMKVMLGHYPFHRLYWRTIWKYICPSLIIFILIFSFIDLKPASYGDYVYPWWASLIGWGLSILSVSAIPIVAIQKLLNLKGPILHRLEVLMSPTADWGPKLQLHRMETHSPKHTDSQVPLRYDLDNDSNDSDDLKIIGKDNYILADEPSDSDTGLRLKIPIYYSETGL
ncbi:sodium- and chloride-dependent glycine transporter 1-like isoform X2 [Oppia nitens]|uniref:sodium- and chloride-dependent glycine transporter 1-like isoform X2 n=1 Tax=Oppia nitens TaxID=1686743 RepID=UPI0023DCBC29|nr:sodium- and chloride-dependent glycine transporter 1-like isoform X2 [Oppia nitens]